MDGTAGEIRFPFDDAPAEGEVSAVAPGILWARLPLPNRLNHVNIYILDDGDGWSIIDTGMKYDRSEEIWDRLLKGPLAAKPVKRVILTHHHPDHVGFAGWFQTELGAKLYTTRTAWMFARMQTLDVQDRHVPQTLNFWRSSGMPAQLLDKLKDERPFNFADVVASMPPGFTRIVDGGTIEMGGREWTIRLGNGHAPAHATFWSEDGELVLAGDQLLPSISPNLGVYANEPEANPVLDWLESCERLSPLATERQLVLPGHKLPYYGLPKRMRQLAENHHGALDRLRKFLREPHTAAECFVPVFKREIEESQFTLALNEAVAHVLYLWHAGEARRTMGDDGAWRWQMK